MQIVAGLDVGSTTVKLYAMAEGKVIFSVYRRHRSEVKATVAQVLCALQDRVGAASVSLAVTGSGGMILEEMLGVPFVQEVIAETEAIRRLEPETEVIIELGGEDSKITYLSGNIEQRMNSICAGGTGAFIDQMASLLDTDAAGLNELAKEAEKIYPIASRCGVFAKTDVQALLNDGASKEDIARSVFQSVVNQTIANLACGRPIKGHITFLGGPLHFLSGLRQRFKETLGQAGNDFTLPDQAQLFVARGAAFLAEQAPAQPLSDLIEKLEAGSVEKEAEESHLAPLFESEADYQAFVEDHRSKDLAESALETYVGPTYLGIDAGSTTSKLVLLGAHQELLFSEYGPNLGKPLEHIIQSLKRLYARLSPKAWIAQAGICGYGEDFIKAALHVDVGEVETIAHYTAARYFNPKVDFILDIGGQDMKAMHIRDGIIDSIQLNESCSSGCGSFLSTFAASVGMSVTEFQEAAIRAKAPADLGSRCTVFMNSKVKQAQKEGASVEDIAAGLCYSVIKNAIQKVIKVRDPRKLGEELVVQGGTFYGDGILRAFELISGRKATRPGIAGLMGAMGMALIAKEKAEEADQARTSEKAEAVEAPIRSTLLGPEALSDFHYEQKSARCGRCTNNCALSIHLFADGSRYISGNRCERGAGLVQERKAIPNLYRYKWERLFQYYTALPEGSTDLPTVGIPRVLNLYENYPLWHTFFTRLGFPVKLSPPSSRAIYNLGLASISSETVCYPAKLVNGHIESLVSSGVGLIWYPSIFYEHKEFDRAQNQINCPVVCGFPEVVENNVESLKKAQVTYLHPFLSFRDCKGLKERLVAIFERFTVRGKTYHLPKKRIEMAVEAAWAEQANFNEDIRREGALALRWVQKTGHKGIVLSGRPYHVDPEVHHGIPDLINSMGLAVLSEDAVAMNAGDTKAPLRVLDQWVYHARLYRAAAYVAEHDQLELIQLNSFGCGLDAVTTDQVQEILEEKGRIYTLLKIDEVSNLGAVKIRIRSLLQALDRAQKAGLRLVGHKEKSKQAKASFTKDMRKDYTILVPAMAPDHFEILKSAMASEGYRMDFLDRVNSATIEAGLKYVNNDSCYPSITVVGQMMEALESGRYDVDRVALLMTQTGGACRASNYVGYIRKALSDMGYPQVPVIALSLQGIESSPGFRITPRALHKGVLSILAGDLIMRCYNATVPYEREEGESLKYKRIWLERFARFVQKPSLLEWRRRVRSCVMDFDQIPRRPIRKPKVGIVGEILVKYLPEANNHLQDLLMAEGAEVVIPDLMDFFLYCMRNAVHKKDLLGSSRRVAALSQLGVFLIEQYRRPLRKALSASHHFDEMMRIEEIEAYAKELVSLGHHYGEGWLLTGEMIELIHEGAPNIVCIQPFGCLPNHITGKGVMKAVRDHYPSANVVAIDYDPGASEVNQINRVKLMMTAAREAMEEKGGIRHG